MATTIEAIEPNKLMDTYIIQHSKLRRFFTTRLGSREAAEDIVQDIAVRVRELDAEIVQSVENPGAFIYRMGCNLMLDRLKKQRRSSARDQDWTRAQLMERNGVSVVDEPDAETTIAARQRVGQIIKILDRLSPQCRRAFHLHKFEGLSHAEVAETLGISRSAVEKLISHALKSLLKQLD